MRTHGTLARWNEDRGFGFITPAQGGDDLFVHISAFPHDGARPKVGELVSFEIEPGPDGKKRAVRIMRPGRQTRPVPARRPAAPNRSRNWLSPVMGLVAVVAIAAYGYGEFKNRKAVYDGQHAAQAPAMAAPAQESAGQSFRCDGRQHCSQMRSCAEATYFIRHCPNTKMDGNSDGVPCEQQWCN